MSEIHVVFLGHICVPPNSSLASMMWALSLMLAQQCKPQVWRTTLPNERTRGDVGKWAGAVVECSAGVLCTRTIVMGYNIVIVIEGGVHFFILPCIPLRGGSKVSHLK